MTQPEALRLAESAHLGYRIGWQRQVAAELRRLHAENERLQERRDALLEALKTYGWHTEDCPQYPTHARPKNWPACTCGFDDAIKAVEGENI